MPIPDYIDNSHHTLEAVLTELIKDDRQLVLDIATGFFRIEAWLRLEDAMNQLTLLRLLIGRDPAIRPAESDRIDLVKHLRRVVQQQLEEEPFKIEYKRQIDRVIAYFQQDHIQMRLFGAVGEKSQFLHAKAYIFDRYSIVGSSNFTPSGLEGNSELNVVNKIEAIARDLRKNWFERFWNDPSVDLDYKSKFIDALNASKFGSKAYTPYQVFLKALYELFKEESVIGEGDRTAVELANFQQEGFARAVRLINKHGGCMVADAVGLGKTYIGLRVLEHYLIQERKPGKVPRALVLCPAQLRDLVWNKKLDEFGIKADVISHEEISRNNGFDIRHYSNYDIIVIDESHNFRNSATNRYRNLQKLINSGNRHKKLVLLTATPINNSVFDLYHQILLLARNQTTYYRTDGISNLKTYFKSLSQGKIEITNLLFETMVRRSRQDVIRRQKAGEEVRIGGKLIHFPERKLENFTYNFEASFSGLYLKIANRIDDLNLAPYNIKAFKKRKAKEDENEVKRNRALVALQKALYLKRLESGLVAFKNSVRYQLQFQKKFYQILTEEGKLLDSKNFRKLVLALEDEEELHSATEIIDSLEPVDAKQYNLSSLKEQIEADLSLLDDILTMLDTIETSVETGADYDRKLAAFKELLRNNLKGQKILVFSYFKDTAQYLHNALKEDAEWLKEMTVNERSPVIELITGGTSGKQRKEMVSRFAPKANHEKDENLQLLLDNPIDILICTDVLSEGQNLQDAGVLVNYDLHWNPVRMIQRAGRIDRLGTDYNQLYIYNCFPEEGLEELLGLVKRLQERIATIDREVGLDASVLGEVISEKSLEELFRLKRAITEAEKQEILEELEQASDLISLDEMRLPLLEYIQRKTAEEVEDIPLGIHSTRYFKIPHKEFAEGGVFFAFKADDNHYWYFYPRINNAISTDLTRTVTDKRKIFNWIKCQESDFPPPDRLPPAQFDLTIFPVLDSALNNLMLMFEKQQTSSKVKPALTKLLNNVLQAFVQPEFFQNPASPEIAERIVSIISTINLNAFERDIRRMWDRFKESRSLAELAADLDEFFAENELYEMEEDPNLKTFKMVKREDIQLVCYEWFYPRKSSS